MSTEGIRALEGSLDALRSAWGALAHMDVEVSSRFVETIRDVRTLLQLEPRRWLG